MAYIVVALLGMAGGAFCVFMILEAQRKRLGEQKEEQHKSQQNQGHPGNVMIGQPGAQQMGQYEYHMMQSQQQPGHQRVPPINVHVPGPQMAQVSK